MEVFFHRLLCFLLLFHNVRRSTAVKTVQGFTLYNPQLKLYMKATLQFRRITALRSSTATKDTLFRWQWTKDGQMQNIRTRLCLDVDSLNDNLINAELRLCECNFRKSFQKWRCHEILDSGKKYYYVSPAHTRKRPSWRVMQRHRDISKGYAVVLSPTIQGRTYLYCRWGASTNVIESLSPNICDLNHRDVCVQTVGKIPNTGAAGGTCVSSIGAQSYISVAVPSFKFLTGFTISVWIKGYPQDAGALFSYSTRGLLRFNFVAHNGKANSEFYISGRKVKIKSPGFSILSGYWTHLVLIWEIEGTLQYYVNGVRVYSSEKIKGKSIPGFGILWLARATVGHKDVWYTGLMSQFHIMTTILNEDEIAKLSRRLHCCIKPPRNIKYWLNWETVAADGKKFGLVRFDAGAACTSFEALPKSWLTTEQMRRTCHASLSDAHVNFIPDHPFTASSSSSKKPITGRVSPRPWCPDRKDQQSYLEVNLGSLKNVTAFATVKTAKKYSSVSAKHLKVAFSVNGIRWTSDGKVYSVQSWDSIKEFTLRRSVLAQYVRFYPTKCKAGKCCLAVEVYCCDSELDKRLDEAEDGCTREEKPFMLMDLGELHHVKRIQIGAQIEHPKNPVRSFYFYYMSWNQWIPYQEHGETKVFKGTSETKRMYTYILQIPILARFIKIYPVPKPACGEFLFIGCRPPHVDACDRASIVAYKDCAKYEVPQCKPGFIGNGVICQDLNECEMKHGTNTCDGNSICKNQYGSYECLPCRNQLIGDGKICRTSCEALGLTCDQNAYCDMTVCRCVEGYVGNGTRCVEDENFKDEEDEKEDRVKEEIYEARKGIVGSCDDGFFNCYGDVIGALEKLKNLALSYVNFDFEECQVLPNDLPSDQN